jgi:radical SAM superfamily enzyme YgiQ (UPF0313 family)
MKILLVYPQPQKRDHSLSTKIQKTFFSNTISSFQALGNVTPAEHSLKILDERFEKINVEDDYDLIGISAMTYQAPRAYAIADEFIKKGKQVVLGGWHPSAMPQEAKHHATALVMGEGEEVWPRLLQDAERGVLQPLYRQEQAIDFSSVPFARTSKRNLTIAAPIEATRGCPYGCAFCAITNSAGYGTFHVKSVERVIAEIQSIPQKYLLFNDASLTIDVGYTKRLFEQMAPLHKKFYCFGNAHTLIRDDELLRLAHEAGCISWSIGFDSISQQSIHSIGKRSNVVDEYKAVIQKIHDFGMNVAGSFMFGFDSDTLGIFDETSDFVCDSDIDSAAFHILTPFPGTPLFTMYDEQQRILTKDWSQYDCTKVVFQPKNMTTEELLEGYMNAYERFYGSNVVRIIGRNATKGLYPLFIGIVHSLQVLKKVTFSRR